jgi:hypothetical protein
MPQCHYTGKTAACKAWERWEPGLTGSFSGNPGTSGAYFYETLQILLNFMQKL